LSFNCFITPHKRDTGGAMEKFETRFRQVDVLPLVKHYMDELDLFNLFTKYVPAASDSLAGHAESLCILTANIICDNKL